MEKKSSYSKLQMTRGKEALVRGFWLNECQFCIFHWGSWDQITLHIITSLGSIILGFLALFLFGKKAEIERKFSELSSYLVQHPAFHPNPLGSSMKTLVFCLWLCWVFVAAHGLSLVVASGGSPLVAVSGLLIVASSRCRAVTRHGGSALAALEVRISSCGAWA